MADPIKMEMEKDEEEYFVTLHVKEIKNDETTIKEGKRSHIFLSRLWNFLQLLQELCEIRVVFNIYFI